MGQRPDQLYIYIVLKASSTRHMRNQVTLISMDSDETKMSKKSTKRSRDRSDRSVEYDKEKSMRAIRSQPESKEAKVLAELTKCRNNVMVKKTQEFLDDFKQQGFGFVEGSKWSSFTTRDQHTQEDSYMTEAQILKEECGDEANAQAKIKFAESFGEGVDEDGKRKGWYRDDTREGAPVYYYAKNMVHAVKLRDDKKLATKQSTGNMAIKGDGVLSLPSDPGSVPEALDVGRGCGSAESSNESAPVPKAPKVATSEPNTPSACTEPTNSEDSEAQEAKTTVEVAKEPETVEVADETQASAEKAVPKKPAEDQKINLLKEAKDHLCIYYAFIFYVTIYFTYIYMCAICF